MENKYIEDRENLFSNNPCINIQDYLDSDLTISEIEKIEKSKIQSLRKDVESKYTIKDYYYSNRMTIGGDNIAFCYPYKDGDKVKYNAIRLGNSCIKIVNDYDFYKNNDFNQYIKMDSAQIKETKKLKNLVDELKDKINLLYDIKSPYLMKQKKVDEPTFVQKLTLDLSCYLPNSEDKTKRIKDILDEINMKNEVEYNKLKKTLLSIQRAYSDKFLYHSATKTIVHIKDIYISDENDSYKIKTLIDAIFFKILFGRDELVCYKIDSVEDFGYISDFATMLETYSFLYGKREAFMETMEYIKEIDKIKDKSIFYQK